MLPSLCSRPYPGSRCNFGLHSAQMDGRREVAAGVEEEALQNEAYDAKEHRDPNLVLPGGVARVKVRYRIADRSVAGAVEVKLDVLAEDQVVTVAGPPSRNLGMESDSPFDLDRCIRREERWETGRVDRMNAMKEGGHDEREEGHKRGWKAEDRSRWWGQVNGNREGLVPSFHSWSRSLHADDPKAHCDAQAAPSTSRYHGRKGGRGERL